MPNNKAVITRFNLKLVHALLQLAKHQGVSLENALAHSAIKQDTLDTPGQRYPTQAFEALLSHLIDTTGNSKFATLAAEVTQPRMLGSLGFVMTTANTLLDAYQMLSDYFPLVYEGVHLEILHEQENCILNLHFTHDSPQVSEFFVGCLLNWPRWLTGRAIPAQSISYNFSPANPASYQQQLALNVSFDHACNQVVIHNQYMNLACSETNPDMHQLHCKFADSLLVKSSQKQALIAQTKHHIRKVLQDPAHDEGLAIRREHIAASLNMSLRTFQRKLNAQDSNFQKIYDTVRHETCLQFMTQPNINFGQIAYKLGFSNLSAFQKAFKRWMKVSPSQYRKQIAFIQAEKNSSTKAQLISPSWHIAMNEDQLSNAIKTKLNNIGNFSKHLLIIAALAQQTNEQALTLEQLSKISKNSIARLSIYLWPAQQEQLIENTDNIDPKAAIIQFTPQLIMTLILKEQTTTVITQQHFAIAGFYQTQEKPILALKHYLLAELQQLKPQHRQHIAIFCEHQIRTGNAGNSAHLNTLYQLQIDCLKLNNEEQQLINQLCIEQVAIWVELNHLEKAQPRVSYLLEQTLSLNQRVELSIIASGLLVELKQAEQALNLLTQTAVEYCGIADATSDQNNVLIDISHQLEFLDSFYQKNPEQFTQPLAHSKLSDQLNNKLSILQKIITICLHENWSLKAAGAIAKMFAITLTHCDHYYASFACAHFSWVCSWFAADIGLAKSCRDRSLFLAKKHSVAHLQTCELILFSKVNHWLEPLLQSIHTLQLEAEFHNQLTDKNALQRQVLLQQLLMCTGESLNNISNNCQQILEASSLSADSSHALSLMLNTIKCIKAPAGTLFKTPSYINSSNAFGQIFSALYRFDNFLWPLLQNWDALIESDISSHYIATEAVFMCTLMRIHNADSSQHSPLIKARFDGDINRLNMWGKLQSENFSVQHAIAQAAYHAKFSSFEQAVPHFETAFIRIEKQAHLQHKILFYHYYALLLKTKHPALSTLCSERKEDYLSLWLQ